MALDIDVGLFLDEDGDEEADRQSQRILDDVNHTLRRLGLPEHREPRSPAEVGDGVDCGLLGVRLGFYGSAKYERLDDLARHVAVFGAAPRAGDAPDTDTHTDTDTAADDTAADDVDVRYDALPDRRLAFDHVIAATGMGAVLLPRAFDEVVRHADRSGWYGPFLSAARLRVESVALGHVLRYADSPVHDWISGDVLADTTFAHLTARIEDDPEVLRSWAEEADLCSRLLHAAHDVLDSGALGITS